MANTKSTVKIVSNGTPGNLINSGGSTPGTIDDIIVIPGTKRLGADVEDAGGGAVPVVRLAEKGQQSFECVLVDDGTSGGADAGIDPDCLWELFRSNENVTLSGGSTNPDGDFDATGPVQIELTGDAVSIARITVG